MATADDLARASRRLYALGWMRGTSGNVSMREGSQILVTASGVDKSAVEPADAVLIDARGEALPGQQGRPPRSSGSPGAGAG